MAKIMPNGWQKAWGPSLSSIIIKYISYLPPFPPPTAPLKLCPHFSLSFISFSRPLPTMKLPRLGFFPLLFSFLIFPIVVHNHPSQLQQHPPQQEEINKNSLQILENVCRKKNDPKEGDKEGGQRRAKRAVTDLVVSNLLSVITGSFMNDFVMSNFWDKLTFCFKTIFSREHFFRGWKRCWEYWRLSEQKWRKALKPHLMVHVHRLAANKLRALDAGGTHYMGAMIQIQEEYNKLLLDGAQSTRLLNILRDAGLSLPDLHWRPILDEMEPGKMAAKIVEMDWRATIFEFHSIFNIYNKLLNVLEEEFRPIFDKIKEQKQIFDGGEQHKHKIVILQGRGENGTAAIQPNWEWLGGGGRGIGEGAEHAGKYLAKIVEWIGGELRHFSQANQLFLHAALAGYVAQMLGLLPANEVGIEELKGANKLAEMSECLLELVKTVVKDESGREIGKFGEFEGHDRKYLNFKELNNAIKWHAKKRMMVERGDPKVVKNVAMAALEEYGHLLKAANGGGNRGEKCGYASGVLQLEFAEINEKLEVKLDGEKIMAMVGGEGKRGREIRELLETIREGIQRMFNPNGRPKVSKSKEHIGNRYGKAEELGEKGMRHLENVLVLTNLAIFGHILAGDIEREKEKLNRILSMLGKGGMVLRVDQGKADQFKAVAEKLLEWMHRDVMKLKASDIDKFFDPVKLFMNSLFKFELKMADKAHLDKFVGDEFELAKRKMGNWLEATLVEVENEERDRAAGGPATIGLPMRLSEDAERAKAMEARGERTLLERALKKMEYANKHSNLFKHKEEPLKREEGAEKVGRQEIGAAHPRKKRLVDAIFWGLVTGWLGNWISQYVDISLTIRNCFFRFKCEIAWTEDALRRQREKGMLNFLGKSYKILIGKLVKLDTEGKAMDELNKEMSTFLMEAVHAQGKEKEFSELTAGNILLELEILTYSDFRHHIEQIIDHDEDGDPKEEMLLRVLRDFAGRGWLDKDEAKNYKHCVKHHKRIMDRLGRKKCARERLEARLEMVDPMMMENHWMYGKEECGGGGGGDGEDGHNGR